MEDYSIAVMGRPTFKIKTYVGNHMCKRTIKNKQATAKWVAEKWDDVIKVDPNLVIETLGGLVSNGLIYLVDLDIEECDCCKWKISGMPCPHAIQYLDMGREEIVASLVHIELKSETQRQTYVNLTKPTLDQSKWKKMETGPLLPLLRKWQLEMSSYARRKEPDSPVRVSRKGSLRCTLCN